MAEQRSCTPEGRSDEFIAATALHMRLMKHIAGQWYHRNQAQARSALNIWALHRARFQLVEREEERVNRELDRLVRYPSDHIVICRQTRWFVFTGVMPMPPDELAKVPADAMHPIAQSELLSHADEHADEHADALSLRLLVCEARAALMPPMQPNVWAGVDDWMGRDV